MNYLQQAPSSLVIIHGQQAQAYIPVIQAPAAKPRPHSVSDAIRQWLDYLRTSAPPLACRQNRLFIEAFSTHQRLDNKPLAGVTEANVNAWVNSGNKLGSRRVRLAIVRSFMKFCSIRQLLTTPNPSLLARVDMQNMSHDAKESHIVEPFSDADFRTLLDDLETRIAACGDAIGLHERKKNLTWWKSAVVISRNSGLRIGDIATLETASFRTGEMVVWSRKRGRRVVPHILDRQQFESVAKPLAALRQQYCFPEIREVYIDPRTRCNLNTQFKRLCLKLGLKSHRFHSIRHFWATECLRCGHTMEEIAKGMGHTSTETTRIYTSHP